MRDALRESWRKSEYASALWRSRFAKILEKPGRSTKPTIAASLAPLALAQVLISVPTPLPQRDRQGIAVHQAYKTPDPAFSVSVDAEQFRNVGIGTASVSI